MPIYKEHPHRPKSKKPLPLYRPIDHFVWSLWEKRKALAPFFIVGLGIAAALGGLKLYTAHYESKGRDQFNAGLLEEVVRDYPRSRSAALARLKLGKTAMDQKNWSRAVDWYRPIGEDASGAPLLRVAALENMALATWKQGDPAQALSLLEKASRDSDNANTDYTQLLIARVQEEGGQKDKAREIYKSLSEGARDLGVRDEAKERLSWLE